ncbi:MAG: MerR family transcriptional regulator [Aureispira sp.]|nr:MerR family transcriptional regulator [Aureispira sp.]
MATYSIKDLEKLSGIKAHTIRIWEQRYNIIEPKRTDTNIRYYTDKDLKYVLNIAFLNKSGMRISKISKMSSSEIVATVKDLSKDNYDNSAILQTLTMAMVELDSQKFEEVLDNNIDQDGFETTILNVIVPFMEKLGLLWFTGSISAIHEQFVYCLIRQKIIATIDKLAPPEFQKDKVVLYLPEGEEQEINILLVYYLLKYRGVPVVYLGSHIPVAELDIVYRVHNPKYVYTIPSEMKSKDSPQEYVDKLCNVAPQRTFLIGTHQVSSMFNNLPSNAHELEDFNAVIEFFDNKEA